MKRPILELLLLASFTTAGAMAQINCATGAASRKLVCEFPFATGQFANDTALGTASSSGVSSAQLLASSIDIGIATQVSQLPLASASAGTVEVYKAGVPETFNNLGPILTDRAQTVGRHRFFLGVTASQFVFTDIDGTSLTKLPFAWAATAYVPGSSVVATNTYTTENTLLHFKIDQFIAVATYGFTNKFDVTAIVPVEYVSLGATTKNSTSYIVNANGTLVFGPYSNTPTYAGGTASGLGDITFNAKYSLWSGEHATVAAAANVRVPTGDDLNYLGSGSVGINPYVVYSYLAKVSPHAKIGYQWNTATELNPSYVTSPSTGLLTYNGNQNLPGGVQYDLGADWAAAKHLTVAADLLGSQFLNTSRLIPTTTTITTTTGTITLNTSVTGNSSYTISNLSTGFKINPFRDLVLAGNVLFQLNNNGLRSRPTPLIGISYKF
jgi:hypothetical protein